MEERSEMTAEEKWEYDLEFGEEFEEEFKELNNKKIECKDESRKFPKTGNIFIEYEYRESPSGIEKTESDYWVEKLSDGLMLVIKTDTLRQALKILEDERRLSKVSGGDDDASKGYLVKPKELIKAIRELKNSLNLYK